MADPYLRDLRDATGDTVHMAAREGDEMIYLAKFDGRHAYQMRSHVGLTIAMHSTAVGKCLLAALSPSEVRAIVARVGLPKRTEHTITEVDKLLEHLEVVRRKGFACDEEENEVQVRCVGALVVDSHGLPVASVSVSSLSFDLSPVKFRRHAELVVAAAHRISHALGAVTAEAAPTL